MNQTVNTVLCVLLFFFLFNILSCKKTYEQTTQQEIIVEENNEEKAKLIEISKIKERIKFYEDGLRWRINSNDEKFKEEIIAFQNKIHSLYNELDSYEQTNEEGIRKQIEWYKNTLNWRVKINENKEDKEIIKLKNEEPLAEPQFLT